MDAFFAAIEERNKPRLKGRPIVVGADPEEGRGRGVVSTANYKAREYGIHSAMPISRAWQLSEQAKKSGKPEAAFISGNFNNYGETSVEIMSIVKKYVKVIEEASVDEAYMDLSFAGSYAAAEELCKKIKKEIKDKERLTASIGIGPNKLIAKIASDMQKPDGLTVIAEEQAEVFLEPLSIRKIPGIGPKAEIVFKKEGTRTVKDLKKYTQGDLYDLFGEWGLEIYEKARGRDNSPVVEEYEIKSIGEQETFMKDTLDPDFILKNLKSLCRDVISRFEKSDFYNFRTVVITVRFEDFETKTRAYTLPEPASDLKTLEFEAMRLLVPFLDRRENSFGKALRLIGVQIEKFTLPSGR